MFRLGRLLWIFVASALCLANCATRISPQTIVPTCTITTTDVKGVMDSFGGGIDPTWISPALAAFLTSNPPRSQYDEPGCDKHFGGSFHLCMCETCGARLEIQVRKCGVEKSEQLNDSFVVGVAPFVGSSQRVAQGQVWTWIDPNTKMLTVTLPSPQLSNVLCKNQTTDLDVYMQDDTIVDWMRLTVQHP